jgi:transcriptional antiterminator RfaH
VSRLIGHGYIPTPVMAGVVEELKRRQGDDGLLRLESPAARFTRGDAVRVVGGAFEACLGMFEASSDQERVAILLDLLGRKVRIVLDADAIEAA